jgi:transposase
MTLPALKAILDPQEENTGANVHLLFLPAYSPDFNPIEKDWANMKRALRDTLPLCD